MQDYRRLSQLFSSEEKLDAILVSRDKEMLDRFPGSVLGMMPEIWLKKML